MGIENTQDQDFNLLSKEYFNFCIENNKPYFGAVLQAYQQPVIFYTYMDKMVDQECSKGKIPYNILEIGSWVGMSAITWAKAIQKYNKGNGQVFCVDPWKVYLKKSSNIIAWNRHQIMNRACSDGQAFRLFLHNIITSNCGEYIKVIKAESSKVLPTLKTEFDLIYIDGNHEYTPFKEDLINSSRLVKDNGILCGDDCTRNHPIILKTLNEMFGFISHWGRFWAIKKVSKGWEPVEIENFKIPEHLKEWQTF